MHDIVAAIKYKSTLALRHESYVKRLSITWRIAQNLVACGVAWAVFTVANSNFETAVLALLVLIYATILSFQITTSASLSERHLAANKQFVNVL